jgi:hypothetical protein
VCVHGLTIGNTYTVQVASYPGEAQGRMTIDLLCPGVCDAPCDDVNNACDIACGGSLALDNTHATTDPLDPVFSCTFGGPSQGVGTLWLKFVATDTSAKIDTAGSTAFDALAVYSHARYRAGLQRRRIDPSSLCPGTIGQTYYIQVASFSSFDVGGTVNVDCPCGEASRTAPARRRCRWIPCRPRSGRHDATDDITGPCGPPGSRAVPQRLVQGDGHREPARGHDVQRGAQVIA